MGNTRYRLNPNTLSFEKQEKSVNRRIRIFLLYFGAVLVLATAMSWIFLSYYETPGMKSVKQENKELRTQYENLGKKLGAIESTLSQIQEHDDNLYRVMFGSDPIPATVRKAGFGGVDKYSELESFRDADYIIETARRIDLLSKQTYIQAKSYEELIKLATSHEQELASTPAIIPIANNELSFTSSGFGMRRHPVYKIPKFHYGIDFVAPMGAKIYATGDGVVESVKQGNGYGKHIVINHGFGVETLYAHLIRFNVAEGQKVKRGDLIGFVGNTGISTAPHLHYEVHKNGKAVNPVNFFIKDVTPEEYSQILASSKNIAQPLD